MSDDAAKVLYVSFDVLPDPTGTSARATELLRGVSPVFQTDALTAKTPDHSHIERYYGVRLLRVPVGSGDMPERAQAFERAVKRQLESDEYQLAFYSDPHGGYALSELKGKLGTKLVYAPTSFPSIELRYTHPELEGNRKFLAKLQRQELFCLMNADRVVVPSEVTRAYVLALGVAPERVTVIPPPVDVKLFGATPEPPEDGPTRLLYVGSMAPWQGLPTLLFALRQAVQKSDVRLAVVGPRLGSWRRQLEELVRELKLAGRVELADPVPHDEVPKLLAQAHLVVAPLEKGDRNAKQGAAPLKIAEALVAGRPVIASDLPITRAMLDDGVHGVLTRPGDATDLARVIGELAADPARRKQLAAAARRHGKARYDADHARRALLLLFHDLIAPSIVVSDDLMGEAAPAAPAEGDGYTVSSMPTTIGARALVDEVTAAPAARQSPTTATQPVAPPRKPKLRPAGATSSHEDTNPGLRAPVPPGSLEPAPEDESTATTTLQELPDEALASAPEPTPVGPEPTPVGPGPEPTPVGPAPERPEPATDPGLRAPAPGPTPAEPPRLTLRPRVEPGPAGEPPVWAPPPLEVTPVGPPPAAAAPPGPPVLTRSPAAAPAPAPAPAAYPWEPSSTAPGRPLDGGRGSPDWFDRLLLGETPAAADRGGDASEAPSQVVVGQLLDEPAPRRRDGTHEDSSPGFKP